MVMYISKLSLLITSFLITSFLLAYLILQVQQRYTRVRLSYSIIILLPFRPDLSQTHHLYTTVMFRRNLLRSILFILLLCDPVALALQCRAALGTNINTADCVMAIRSAFSIHPEPTVAQEAETRMFLNRADTEEELQAMPRTGVYGTCAIIISMSQHMLLGSLKQIKEDALHLVSGCVGAYHTGGTHQAHLFNFVVMHHRIVAHARMAHQRQPAPGMQPIPPPKPKGHPAPAV